MDIKKVIKVVKNLRINHSKWIIAYKDIQAALIACMPGEVLLITGASRVGKSKLIQEIMRILFDHVGMKDDGSMPYVFVPAANCSVNGSFSTKAFILRALEAIEHPMYGECRPSDEWGALRFTRSQKTPEGVLRLSLERALVLRKTKYLVIDEAQHFRYVKGGDKNAAAILDSWKTLAESTGVVLILVGAYPILNVIKQSPHLLGRLHQTHFPRYYKTENDLAAYTGILQEYGKEIANVCDGSVLMSEAESLYDKSFGCIGLTNKYIRDALSLMSVKGDSELTKDHFIFTAANDGFLESIASEIYEGEKILRSSVPSKIIKLKGKKKSSRVPFEKLPRRYAVLESGIR